MNKIEDELKAMEEGLRRLKVEYQIFFNGNRKKPPEDLRLRLERISKQLSDRSDLSHAQRFHYNTLVTRYYTLRNLWHRILQEREKGNEPPGAPASAAGEPGGGAPGSESPKEAIRVSLSDPETEKDKVRDLYEALLRHKIRFGSRPEATYRQFAEYIAGRTQTIRAQYACRTVVYTIAPDGDTIRFTAAAGKS